MGLFKKQTQSLPEQAPGRRRPVADQTTQRTQAFSYYAQRSQTSTNTGRGQLLEAADSGPAIPRPWYVNRTVVSVIGVVAAVLIAYLSTLTSAPQVVPLTTGGNAYFLQDGSIYQQAVDKSFSRSIFNRSKLTIDSAGISRELTALYPELASATVTTPLFGHRASVYVTPYAPSLMLTTVDNKVFLLDTNGRALAANSQITATSDLHVPTLEDKSGLTITLGKQALPANTVHFITEVLTLLAAARVSYSQLVLPPASSELDVYVTGAPYFVKFNLQGDAKLEVGTYLATKQRLLQNKTTPTQYIDVRVNERAYYK